MKKLPEAKPRKKSATRRQTPNGGAGQAQASAQPLAGNLSHGSEACAALEVHPMFPTTPEIAAVADYLAAREPKF